MNFFFQNLRRATSDFFSEASGRVTSGNFSGSMQEKLLHTICIYKQFLKATFGTNTGSSCMKVKTKDGCRKQVREKGENDTATIL